MIYDIKIVNARYLDFDKNEFVTKDICIKDGIIEYIGNTTNRGDIELDASEYITSPGFIDIHMHEEELNTYESLDRFYIGQRMLNMGVTTGVGGNCGLNIYPPSDFINEVNAYKAPINYMLQIGYNTLRQKNGLISPYDSMTPIIFDNILEDIKYGMELGLKGISYGIEYSPGITFEEMYKSACILDTDAHILSAHYRSDGKESLGAIEEMIDVSKQSKVPMQVSHIGSCSAYGNMKESLDAIERANDKGIDVMADCYPYNAFCTHIGSEVFKDGCLEKWSIDYDRILLTEGIYKNTYCNRENFHIARSKYPDMLAVVFAMNEDEVIMALNSPYVMIASDEIYRGDKGHPRGAGTFPRVLGRYVRENNDISLESALYKMTKMPAQRLGLHNKGEIKVGFDADITIFDRGTIIDNADFMNPTAPPTGITHVLVNGKLVINNGVRIGNNEGIFLSADN